MACYELQFCRTFLLTSITCQLVDEVTSVIQEGIGTVNHVVCNWEPTFVNILCFGETNVHRQMLTSCITGTNNVKHNLLEIGNTCL